MTELLQIPGHNSWVKTSTITAVLFNKGRCAPDGLECKLSLTVVCDTVQSYYIYDDDQAAIDASNQIADAVNEAADKESL